MYRENVAGNPHVSIDNVSQSIDYGICDLRWCLQEDKYAIVTDRWQKFSDVYLDEKVLAFLAKFADEFLVHGVDVEGKKYVFNYLI